MQLKFKTPTGTLTLDCASFVSKTDVMLMLVAMQRLVDHDFETLAYDNRPSFDDEQ